MRTLPPLTPGTKGSSLGLPGWSTVFWCTSLRTGSIGRNSSIVISSRKYSTIDNSNLETFNNKNLIQNLEATTSLKDVKLKALSLEELHSDFLEWFRGLTDAEGCFRITLLRGYFWRLSFEMKLHLDDVDMLDFIQKTLGLGKVYKSGNSCRFIVSKQSEVKKILETFTQSPLNSSKALNFIAWRKAFELYT